VKVFKYLKDSLPVVFAILLLLVIQAVCDLALPNLTSRIVDVGIMQGGIEDAVPVRIRRESLTRLELLMSDEDTVTVEAAYTPGSDAVLELQAISTGTQEALNKIFSAALIQATAQLAGQDLGALSDTAATQIAAQFIRQEYTALGMDLEQIQLNYMLLTGGRMLGMTLISVMAAILVGLLASRTAAKISRELRGKVYAHTLSFSGAEIDKFTTASLITRNTNDIQQIQMAMVLLLRMVLYAPIIGIGGIIMVAGRETGLGWIIAVSVAFILVLVSSMMGFTMPKFKLLQTLVDRVNQVSREILTGLPVIRAFSRERHEEARFDAANRDLMKTQLFTNRVMSFMLPIMMLVMNVISIGIIWFGAKQIDLGHLLVGDMIAFITYTMQIVMSFMMLSMVSVMLPRANVAAERIEEVLNTKPVITDKGDVAAEKATSWQGMVRFEDVSFRYPGAETEALQHISFIAEPGRTTAIIGSTGSGKSTLINLLPRFYDVSEGRVTIDGVDIRDMSQHELHSILGFVPQKAVLFSGDIASNLKFGNPDISDADMEEAANIAQALEFIEEKDGTYASPIAQGGSNVSGGQKQRLSIARAVAKKPKVFVFDDSFSALDYKTDAALRHALNEKLSDTTVIIVAQRISTILRADTIIVLDEGGIKGVGSHRELMVDCETYQEIARSQLSEEEITRESACGAAQEVQA
jgi:ATP-binding cassette subfamily B protein